MAGCNMILASIVICFGCCGIILDSSSCRVSAVVLNRNVGELNKGQRSVHADAFPNSESISGGRRPKRYYSSPTQSSNCTATDGDSTQCRYPKSETAQAGGRGGTMPADCWEIFQSGCKESGIYDVRPATTSPESFPVYCQMDSHGGGWTVIQNRRDGLTNFFQKWKDYELGFGNLDADFWLGLKWIHRLSHNKLYELLIEVKDFEGESRFATYATFLVGSADQKYSLLVLGSYNGTAGDSLTFHTGQRFSTWDADNDNDARNCALLEIGAWWFNNCLKSDLNGPYLGGTIPNVISLKGVNWGVWKGDKYSLMETRMSIRPRGAIISTASD